MTTATAAIAKHLNIAEALIAEVQEWAHVLWVRVKGVGARFVSKRVAKMEIIEAKATFYFWKNAPSTIVMMLNTGETWLIPVTGNAQYGWNRRRKINVWMESLIDMGSIQMQRLVASGQGVPNEYLPQENA